MNRREYLLSAIATAGGGYALWDVGVLSLPDGVDSEMLADAGDPPTATPDAEPAAAAGGQSTATETPEWDAVPKLVHQRVNEFRVGQGQRELRWSPALAEMAADWARQMRDGAGLRHRGGDLAGTAREFGAQCDAAGENIAQTWIHANLNIEWEGKSRYDTPGELSEGLFRMWESSDGHRENMLYPRFYQAGIGVVIEDDGSVWAVQNFC